MTACLLSLISSVDWPRTTRLPSQIYGDPVVRTFIEQELARCKPEHLETTERIAALDPALDLEIEAKTITLLEQHAAAIRQHQAENNFTIPGIPELIEALRGRSTVRLHP
jgi:hypothetical protein